MNREDEIRISDGGGTTLWTRPNSTPPKFGDIESRLDRIAAHAESYAALPNRDAASQAPRACDPAQELGVKAEAARWMLRVAKHLSEPSREKVLVAVLRSLDELEQIVDTKVHHIEPPVASRLAHASSGR